MQLESAIQPAQPLVPHPPAERGMFAPKEGNVPDQPKLQDKGYDQFLNEICDKIDRECNERAEVRARRFTRNHNYWWGGERRWQYWTKDGFKNLDAKKTKRLFSNNQFAYQVRTILSVVTRSHPRLTVSPAPSVNDDAQKVSAAHVATRTLKHDQREKLTAEFAVGEWTNRILYGIAIRGQWYAKEGSTAKARAPIVEQQDIQMPGMYVCPDCGATGPEGNAQEHTASEGHQVNMFPGEVFTVPVHAGYEEIQDGDCLTYGISPYEFDLAPEARDIASSPYARWQRKDRKSTRLNSSHLKLSRMPSSA